MQTFIPGPPSPTDNSMFGCVMDEAPVNGERDSVCMMLDVDDITPVVESAAVKCAAFLTSPNISPVKNKPTAKPRRTRTRAHAEADPIGRSGREQRRKDKQRGYEKNYRSRKKQTREQDAEEWVKLELVALDLWGGVTSANREIRAQMNALPSLPKCHIFNFTWS
ncbi:hypothetical protein BBO99_00009106 [Phytophthora kernoviae]|nr:hypothetical protein G195_010671 [Phytophthora kernoviae 00238/432]KAG2514585.1 hypothetical protein JM16_007837 [Phytophthora kernoviae]KAG2518246.1 hypothetical protein JM18_007760 [Phytophthora kernoviae]RLN27112.1 hypothetical protein BBI17_008085 [Phytophthora kernoviae]RLN74086.1 hypothetical protein BBO99_00009106 [Phytophthora kernoviae]